MARRNRRTDDDELEEAAVEQLLQEVFETGQALREAQIDRGGRLISNVTLLGKVSKNGRVYSDQAMNDAVRLFERAPFYLDHPTEAQLRERKGARPVMDLAGQIVNARRVGDSVRGDIHVLEREPMASFVFALAEQMPNQAGMSLRGHGKVRPSQHGQGEVVEGLASVAAVELVTDPATTTGLFESINHPEGDVDFKTLTAADIKKHRPELIEALVRETQPEAADALALKREVKSLKEQLADKEATEQESVRAALITKKLAEAKLPDVLVTEQFKTQLKEAASPAAVSALIAERKAIAGKVKFGRNAPRSTERDLDERRPAADADGTRPIDEEKMGDYARSLGLKLVAS